MTPRFSPPIVSKSNKNGKCQQGIGFAQVEAVSLIFGWRRTQFWAGREAKIRWRQTGNTTDVHEFPKKSSANWLNTSRKTCLRPK
jgi:hypothetical protein